MYPNACKAYFLYTILKSMKGLIRLIIVFLLHFFNRIFSRSIFKPLYRALTIVNFGTIS